MTMNKESAAARKNELRDELERIIRYERVFYGRPTERLAALIAFQLIGKDRYSPQSLCYTIDCIDELKNRLISAKV
tara:strand:- start:79 stop:306 length:228 start_codon:yes stop_codon:yes gene_type:complete